LDEAVECGLREGELGLAGVLGASDQKR
jgi:hypothetical protein